MESFEFSGACRSGWKCHFGEIAILSFGIKTCNMANHNYSLPQIWIRIDFGKKLQKIEKMCLKLKIWKLSYYIIGETFNFLVFKMFLYFSQFLIQFLIQVISICEWPRWDNFFEYWNLYLTVLKVGVMIVKIL